MAEVQTDAGSEIPDQASTADQARMAFVLGLRGRGIADVSVLRALETIPREKFVPRRYADVAWRDVSLPIACGQTMPDPFSVARMVEALALRPDHRVLEIGAGSGYVAAILAQLCAEVVSFERYHALVVEAEARLKALSIDNVTLCLGDGLDRALAAEMAPGRFDRILVHATLPAITQDLENRLGAKGRLIYGVPAASGRPAGLLLRKNDDGGGYEENFLFPMRLLPAATGSALNF